VEKRIASAAYWVAVLSTIVALIMRGLALMGIYTFSPNYMGRGNPITYRTFLEGAALFFMMAIASGLLAWSKERKA